MPKGGRHPTRRRRVVAIFLIAVMLPCLFLSYVGLKSIKQEKLWQQQLVLQNLKSSLTLAVDRIETDIEDQSRTVLNSLSSTAPPLTSDYFFFLRATLRNQGFVEHVFLLDRNLHLVFPRTFRDQQNSVRERKPRFEPKRSEFLRAGESLESRGEFDNAIMEYQKAIVAKLSANERLAFLTRIARCEFKKNDLRHARQTYQKILTEDQQRFYGEEIPYVLIAHLQLVKVAETIDSPVSAATLLADFYRMLLVNFNQFDQKQFEFYLDQVKSRLGENLSKVKGFDLNRLGQLKNLEKEVKEEQALATLMQSTIVPRIQEELSLVRASKKVRYLTVSIEDTLWHIGFQANDESSNPIRIVGFKIRIPMLTSSIQSVCDQIHVSEEIKLALINEQREVIQPREPSATTIVFTVPFVNLVRLLPGYSVGIIATGKNPLETLSTRSLAIYYFLIFSIIVIIILGIVFIFRDISREEELSRMKSEFIANVSHEIKTPIATIRTLAENLNEGWVLDEGKHREYFHLIARESERLSHLVENILDFSRIEAQRKTYRMELVSLGEVLSKTLERFRLLVDGQGVTVEENIPPNLPQAKVDSEAIEQALLNLLDNAVKYSREEKYVGLSVEVEGDNVVIKLTDHGCGIAKGDIQRVFEKFYRVDSRDGKKIPGSGIGLTLVKEIIETHGGRVEVESEVGKGSVFTVKLPIG